MEFEEIEHTADWAFQVRGHDLRELFINAAHAVCMLEHGEFQEAVTLTHELQVEGVDREGLLINWLNELLYVEQTNREAYRNFEILEMDDIHLRARVHGALKHNSQRRIKAVTFHNLQIRQTANGWEATIVLDV